MIPCAARAGAAIPLALAIIGCGAPPVAVPLKQRLDQHMTAAASFCGVEDWRSLFDAEMRGPHIRFTWHEPAAGGRIHPRATEAQCLLGTFGSVTATHGYFEVATSALRTKIDRSTVN